jgi:hypothetical protein
MRSSSGSFLFISLSMLLILKVIKIFKKCYHSVVVMWQHMSSVPVMRTVWRRELSSSRTCSYQCFLSSCTPISLHMLKSICALTLSCHFTYCSFASIGHADGIWSIVSLCCWHSLHMLSVSVCSIFVA